MNSRNSRAIAGLSTILFAATGSMTLAASAKAAPAMPAKPTICEPTSESFGFAGTRGERTVTHAKYIGIAAGSTGSFTKIATHINTITASVTFTEKSTAKASDVVAEVSEEVGVELAASGTKTNTNSESVTFNFNKAGGWAVFAGYKKWSGTWHGTVCSSDGTTLKENGNGNLVSFATTGEGAAFCGSSYSSDSYEYKAKNYAC